jgi:hypothetical protein
MAHPCLPFERGGMCKRASCLGTLLRAAALLWICMGVSGAFASGPHYLITNDDVVFFPTSVSFYTIEPNGLLTLTQQVFTGGYGISGGYFGQSRIAVLNSGTNQCVYASEAFSGDIVGISISTLEIGGSAFGSETDTGASNGIGLALNSQYLYASFTDSNMIGTFQVQPGCSLTFINDTAVVGLQGGFVTAMMVRGNILVVTYGDGSIESFNVANGPPVSNGDKQNSTAYLRSQGAAYPNGVDITRDGHFAIFGDTSTSENVEVSDMSSGKLAKTVVYGSGAAINSSNLKLSPDETLLYVSNTQGDRLSAAFFDKRTGKVSSGCISNGLKGYGTDWAYLGSLAVANPSGSGGAIYVAEFGPDSGIGIVLVSVSGAACSLVERPKSPVLDPNSTGLLSITSFPPRSF